MSASEKAAETAANIVADAAEEVADQAINFADHARQMSKTRIQFYLLGMAVGATTGALIAWKIAYSRAETKYSKIADEEVDEMRRHYFEKRKALESEAAKGDLEDIVTERGYGSPPVGNTPPPMVVKPPTPAPDSASRRRDEIAQSEDEVAGEPPDDESNLETRNLFEEAEITHEWDWHAERRHRSPDTPYVIHVDEKDEMDYEIVTLTYYDGDDVLCRDDDSIIDPDHEREQLVGEKNLERFGHGSEDASIVYIRNDKLEMVFEVCRSPHHYAEEVHGFHHSGYGKNLERMRVRERDEQEE